MERAAVTLDGRDDSRLTALYDEAVAIGVRADAPGGSASDDDIVDPALALASRLGATTPRPTTGMAGYLEALATLGSADVTVARIVEPHLDALAILDECPDPVDLATIGAGPDSTWGVFAAEGPGVRLTAVPDARGWLLEGTKPWCSLAGRLSHALVTAHVDGGRRLFAVALGVPGVTVHDEAWVARGFPEVPSGPADFDRVPAVPVGATGWYLERAGFEWGGIGVAACWFGGALGVQRRILDAAVRKADDLSALHAGRATAALTAARAVLAAAARAVDLAGVPTAGRTDGAFAAAAAAPAAIALNPGDVPVAAGAPAALDRAEAPPGLDRGEAAVLAQVTRTVVRQAAETVLREAARALGPAPLATDAGYAARVADLELYLLQDHGARDEARLGRLLVEAENNAARGSAEDGGAR
ncbi:acyl-CoA dehydrogenase [Herbiconiux solani]|uniref:acyl-CoA dehydrogenase n=1 Tax=Herbiconiux solani TaxID=661329 RepID=UPI0012EDA5B2|nr:acyl-CoA dehydrogenase [Herbiconiux solani]